MACLQWRLLVCLASVVVANVVVSFAMVVRVATATVIIVDIIVIVAMATVVFVAIVVTSSHC